MTTPGDLDLADIEVTTPPAGWTAETVEAEVDTADARDLDIDAEA